MQILKTPVDLRHFLDGRRQTGKRVGLVPTMGALHEGHLSLCRTSVDREDITVVSIFVNPLQFGPGEDFKRYPRDIEADRDLLESIGVDVVFAPLVEVMYPEGFQTWVEVKDVSEPLEGQCRPGHFRGVATVVLKLLLTAGPCCAYFGEKDFQQLQVIRRMVLDLDVPVEIQSVPTVREGDGLALSSRNRYMSREERAAAPAIYRALQAAREAFRGGETDTLALLGKAEQILASEPLITLDYLALVDPETVRAGPAVVGAVVAVAAQLPSVRLIDNIRL